MGDVDAAGTEEAGEEGEEPVGEVEADGPGAVDQGLLASRARREGTTEDRLKRKRSDADDEEETAEEHDTYDADQEIDDELLELCGFFHLPEVEIDVARHDPTEVKYILEARKNREILTSALKAAALAKSTAEAATGSNSSCRTRRTPEVAPLVTSTPSATGLRLTKTANPDAWEACRSLCLDARERLVMERTRTERTLQNPCGDMMRQAFQQRLEENAWQIEALDAKMVAKGLV